MGRSGLPQNYSIDKEVPVRPGGIAVENGSGGIRKVAVTGASLGLGRELALAYAGRGCDIAACDVDGEGLIELASLIRGLGGKAFTMVADVSEARHVEEFGHLAYESLGRVDVLVNNAGVVVGGAFETVSVEDWEWIVGVNLMGVVHGCHFFYPRMLSQDGGGHIVNVASLAALSPLPVMTAYCTTKRAVLAFSEALRQEAALEGIGVTAVCPGYVSTGITSRMRLRSGTASSGGEETARRIDRLLSRRHVPPDRVAATVVKAVERNKPVVLTGAEAYLLDATHRFGRGLLRAVLPRLYSFLHDRL